MTERFLHPPCPRSNSRASWVEKRVMMKKLLFVLFSLVAFSSSALLSQVIIGDPPTLPLICAPGADRLVFADWNSASVREACQETSVTVVQRVIGHANAIQQILPVNPGEFYAYGSGGKLTRFLASPTGPYNSSEWRLPGGGFISWACCQTPKLVKR